jgi:hypothetical protein
VTRVIKAAHSAREMARAEAEMATLPADEDYARAMLTLFAARAARAGQSLPLEELRRAFVVANFGRLADCEAGLAYAETKGWVSHQLDRVRLAAAGYAEI